jgi:hypothetical protein
LDFIGRGIEPDDLQICQSPENAIHIECVRKNLACLNGFLDGQKVWVFRRSTEAYQPATLGRGGETLSILTLIDDFADLWGPVWEEIVGKEHAQQISQYHLSRGVIRRVHRDALTSAVDAVACHWFEPEFDPEETGLGPSLVGEKMMFSKDDLLLIGAAGGFHTNKNCSYTRTMYEESHGVRITPLGTRPSQWSLREGAVGISASQYVGITMMGTQKKFPQVTLKKHIWNRWKLQPEIAPLWTLQLSLGVEVSLHTGNARRVRLMDLLLREPIRSLLRRYFPGWEDRDWGSKFIDALRNNTLEAFWTDHKTMRSEVAVLVCFVIETLEQTGLIGSTFRAAFLNGVNRQ